MKLWRGCFVVALVALLAIVVAPYVIDWNARYGGYVFEQLGAAASGSGASVRALGKMKGRVLTPKLTVNNLYFECGEEVQGCSGAVSIEKLELNLSLRSLIFGALEVKSMDMYGVRTDVHSLSNMLTSSALGAAYKIRVFDSSIVADSSAISGSNRNAVYIRSGEIKSNSGDFSADAELMIGGNKYKFVSKLKTNAESKVASIELTSANTSIVLHGNQGFSLSDGENNPTSGKFAWSVNANTSNMSELAEAIGVAGDIDILSYITSREGLSLTADVKSGYNGAWEVSNFDVKSAIIAGSANGTCDKKLSCEAKLAFSLIDMDELFGNGVVDNGDTYRASLGSAMGKRVAGVLSNLDMRFGLDVKEIRYKGNTSKNLVADAYIREGKLAIDRLLLDLPGVNNRLYISGGTHKEEGDIVPRFTGKFNAEGEDIDEILEWIFPIQHNKEGSVGGNFVLDSDLYIAPRVIALRNITMRSGRANVMGDLKYKYGRRGGAVVGKIVVSNFTADVYNFDENFDFKRKMKEFTWLRNIVFPMQLAVKFRDFTVANRRIGELSFLADVSNRKIGIERIRFSAVDSKDSTSEVRGYAALTLSSQGVRPRLLLNLDSEQYSSEFLWIPKFINYESKGSNNKKGRTAQSQQKLRWSKSPIDLSCFEGMDGSINIKVKKVLFGDVTVSDFLLLSALKEGIMSIDKLAFRQGKRGSVDISGNLGMGDISSISVVVAASNLAIGGNKEKDILRGNVSFSGTLQAQGKNVLEWVNSVKGKLKFAARRFDVKGVDFNGFITDLFNTETKAEVASLSRVYLYRGNTVFDTFEGEANIGDGSVVSSLSFRLASAVGAASLNLFLPQFSITSLCRFSFIPPGDKTRTPASIDMNLQGYLWQPNPTFDIDKLFALSRAYGK